MLRFHAQSKRIAGRQFARRNPNLLPSALEQRVFLGVEDPLQKKENKEEKFTSLQYARFHHSLVRAPGMPMALSSSHNYNPHSIAAHSTSRRQISTAASMLPEFLQGFSIWGGTAILLKTIHMDGVIPYWACFSIINVGLRTVLFPLVLYSAHTAARFGKVAAEIQFFISMFQNDYKQLKASKIPGAMAAHMKMGFQSLRGIYKLHNINPMAAFLSPLLQIPCFIYMSVDLRKLVNGRDPELAQQLTDISGDTPNLLYWIQDLTEPDPVYALPIMAGVFMYLNMEMALGRRNLAGQAASKADMGIILKDVFQSVAVFMPCFASHNPAGMQVYLCTSFLFTTAQSYALRNESFRLAVGLPSLYRAPETPKYGQTFVDLKKLEQQADEIRAGGEILGKYVMAHGFRLSFPGTNRPSTIEVDPNAQNLMVIHKKEQDKDDSYLDIITFFRVGRSGTTNATQFNNPDMPFLHGISAPHEEMERRAKLLAEQKTKNEKVATTYYDKVAKGETMTEEEMMELMEKANRGERPVLTQYVDDQDRKTTSSSSARPSALQRNKKLRVGGGKRKTKKSPRK